MVLSVCGIFGRMALLEAKGTGKLCVQQLSSSRASFQRPSSVLEEQPQFDSGSFRAQSELPLITGRDLQFPFPHREPRQAWLESLQSIEDEKLGILDLHPEVFGMFPRIDILHKNIVWQRNYRKIDYRRVRTRAEMVESTNAKPWPQKGTGRARHGTIRSPLFKDTGGASFGPRGPTAKFYMLNPTYRVRGLCSALAVKFHQNNLHIVDSLDIPTDNPQYLEDLVETRGWGLSVLFVSKDDILNENMALALDEIKQYNAMPAYGLNVYSMLKHETLVLTLGALEVIEKKLLQHLHKVGLTGEKERQST